VTTNGILVGIALASFVAVPTRWSRGMAALFSLIYLAFYAHIDTLMDMNGRFLYPLAPALFWLALPVLVRVCRWVLAAAGRGPLQAALVVIMFVGILDPSAPFETGGMLRSLARGEDPYLQSTSLMQREHTLALSLAAYPDIRSVRIAVGDAGVIPYFTGALHLDTVGLNDRFIARERDLGRLVNYFFSQRADLVLHPATKNHAWITYGHGPLGNYSLWARDLRWDQYSYVGTVRTQGELYDIHFLLRTDSSHFQQLGSFLQEHVIDGYYEPFPLSLGTRIVPGDVDARWHALPLESRSPESSPAGN
jgi:hypothetical protein